MKKAALKVSLRKAEKGRNAALHKIEVAEKTLDRLQHEKN